MCPDKQILSIYLDEELPSPWKEKMETHLKNCPACAEKYENLKRLRVIFQNDINQAYESSASLTGDRQTYTEQEMLDAKSRVWQELAHRRRVKLSASFNETKRANIWQRRLSIPVPAAAAAAVIITLFVMMGLRGGGQQVNNSGIALQQSEPASLTIAVENEIPGVIPTASINDVLKYLSSEGTDVIILTLPESQNFYRTGDPGIIRAADFARSYP